jgi:hypothetical protein
MPYSGKTKIEFCRRLQSDWRDLADYFDIPSAVQASFHKGREPHSVWEWLSRRNRLQELPEALAYIDRPDIVVEVLEPAPPPKPPLQMIWQGSPFPGLRYFTEADAPIFFGRNTETKELLNKIASHRFVAVIGASGSGKSSLVGAGILPRLKELPSGESWQKIRFTPGGLGDDPFLALAAKLEPCLENHGLSACTIAERLHASGDLATLAKQLLEARPATAELLLFIDQFEELFTLTKSEHQRRFIAMLKKAARVPRLRIVFTLRADFYHRCVDYPRLAELLRVGSFPLAPPDLPALMEMITGPAAVAGLSFEDALPGRILRDTGSEPGSLALMAFALAELYNACQQCKTLTLAAYNSFNGVKGAIAKRADTAYKELESDAQNAFGEVFKELVEVDSERGIPTRKRSSLSHFQDSPAALKFIDEFAKARLLVCGETEKNDAVIEVAHEALLTKWPTLKTWIDDRIDDFLLRRQLQHAAADWDAHKQAEAYLWLHERVIEARGMLGRIDYRPTELEKRFLGPIDPARMLEEIDDPATSHERRALIGVRLALIGDPRRGVGLREDGLPDIVWCKVARGEITLANGAGTFSVEPFYVSKYLVTWAQYRAFLEDPDGYPQEYANHPVNNVSWLDAVAFCRWLSQRLRYDIRLPTEWEWQQAATGGDPAKEYPWGPEWISNFANTYESGLSRSTAVGLYPQGASPTGALVLRFTNNSRVG